MTSPTATAEIERLAREAPAGPYTTEDRGAYSVIIEGARPRMDIARFWEPEVGAYIAAVSPDVVLGMIERTKQAEERAERAEEMYDQAARERDHAGYLGTVAACVKDLSDELTATNARATTAEAALRAAEAERERMREALVLIRDGREVRMSDGTTEIRDIADPAELARAALQSTSAKEGE